MSENPAASAPEIGVMVCGHGSRDEGAVREFAQVAEGIKARLPQYPVDSGFLEFANPIIRNGLDNLRDAGVKKILAIPGMLFAAGHAKNDIPSVLGTYAAQNPGVEVLYGRELGVDNKLVRAAGDRVAEAVAKADAEHGPVDRHETLLLVIGRGASDPDANGNVTKITRLLWEGMGFGWAETAYSGVTFPLVDPGLRQAAKLGFKRIIVFPYFLFTGILVNRIYEHTDIVAADLAASQPDLQIVKAGYLNDHPLVLDAFADRVQEILDGANVMNCLNCKYREQVLGFEDEVGQAQESHHHHVEGIGTGDVQKHDHDHSHDHTHDHGHHHHHHGDHTHDHGHDHPHSHHPYPQSDHPMGPYSLPGKSVDGGIECPCEKWVAKPDQVGEVCPCNRWKVKAA